VSAASPPALRRNRDYLRYVAARVVSSTGTSVSTLAYPLLVLSLGRGTVAASLAGTCSMGTRVLLRMAGGSLADRFDRRRLMVAGDLLRFAVLGSLPLASLLGALTYAQILVAAVAEGAATALLFAPASAVAIRDIVPREQMVEASSRTGAFDGTVGLIGPALGGALFALGRMLPFEVDAGSYLLSALLLWRLRTASARRSVPERDRGWSAGVRWLRGQPVLLRCLLAGTLINVTGSALAVTAVIAQRDHGASSAQIGAVMTSTGVGAIIGSLLAPRVVARLRTTACFAVTGTAWTLGFAALALSLRPWVVACALILMVGVTPFGNIGLSAAVTGGTPRHLLGRVSSVITTVTLGISCLGPALGGALLAAGGQSTVWLVFALITGASTAVLILPLVRVDQLVVPDGAAADRPVQVAA
jgi:MFS family permease